MTGKGNRRWRWLMALAALLLLTACNTTDSVPRGTEGRLDLSQWRFESDGPVALAGQWQFHWGELLAPSAARDKAGTAAHIQVPGSWSRQRAAGRSHSADGIATYRLQVLLGESPPLELLLRIPDVYSAYTLWLNGERRANVGRVGAAADTSRAASGEAMLPVHPGESLDIVLQVANHTSRHGGIVRTPELGLPAQIQLSSKRELLIGAAIFAAVFSLGMTQLVVYLFRRRELASLLFGLAAMVWGVRVLFEMQLLPAVGLAVPITLAQRMDSATLFLSAVLYMSFLRVSFPQEYARWVLQLAWLLCASYLIIAMVAEPLTRGELFQYYLWAVGALLLHGVIATGVAALHGREGAAATFLSAGAIALFAWYQIVNLEFSGTRAFYTSFGVLVFVTIQTILLSRQTGRAFNRVERLERGLRRANRLKDEFLANTSHELRTPLHGIVGIGEALLAEHQRLPSSVREALSLIVASGQRLGRLVDDILDFTRLRHDDLKCRPEAVALAGIATAVMDSCRVLVGGRPVELINAVPDDLPPVGADPARLQQILFNLVGNAVKFTDRGMVRLSAERRGDAVRIDITDTGIGISATDIERIFQAYEQVHDDSATGHGGMGLGLAITRRLVQLHGSELTVKSEEGRGSRFSFTLPVRDGEAPPSPARPHPPSATEGTEEETHPSPGGGARGELLAVDDDPIGRQVLERQLSLAGYRVRSAASGPEALARIEQQPPDLVLLDVMMPGMSGFDVCRQIREAFDPTALPVLMLTARTAQQDILRGLHAGANDYIGKPYAREELLARVAAQLSVRQNEQLRWELAQREEARQGEGVDDGADLRGMLVQLLQRSVWLWEQCTGSPRADLADASGLWTVTLDGSVRKTRTLDRYLDRDSLPKRPRWRNVTATARFVSEHCRDERASAELEELLERFTRRFEANGGSL